MLIMAGLYLHTLPAYALIRPQTTADVPTTSEKAHIESMPRRIDWITVSMQSLSSLAFRDPSQLTSKTNIKQAQPVHPCIGELKNQEIQYFSQKDPAKHCVPNLEPSCVTMPTTSYIEVTSCCTEEELDSVAPPWTIPHTRNQSPWTIPHTRNQSPWPDQKRNVVSDKNMILLYINLMLISASTSIVFVHFPSYFYSEGMRPTEMSMLMTVIGSSSFICRILVGALTNDQQISVLLIYMAGGGITGIFILLCPILSESFIGRFIFAIGIGFYGNIYTGLMVPITLTLCSMEDLSKAYGIELFACGLSSLCGPPFAGQLSLH